MGARLRNFIGDILDRSAHPRPQKVTLPDLWAISLLVLSGAASFSESFSKLALNLLGISGSVVPFVLACIGLAWAIFVITAKEGEAHGPASSGIPLKPELTYRHDQPTRYLAKIGMFILIVLLLWQAKIMIDDFIPLPLTVYGYLVDARTRQPVVDAVVRMIDSSGVDVTRYQWPSDSTGFYIIETVRRVRRDSEVVVSQPKCAMENKLPLFRVYETRLDVFGMEVPKSFDHVFKHTITCDGTK
jgi:hypothetical protein